MKKNYTLLTFLIVGIYFFAPQTSHSQTRLADSSALVTLYNNNGGAGWTNSTNWLTTQPLDTWYGIHISPTTRVDSISLPGNNLINAFPNTVNLMTVLAKFDVSNNALTGNMPYFINDSLSTLNVSHNQLTGSLSDYGLPNIQFFRINYNGFSTGIGSVGNYPLIKVADESHNNFTDNVPFVGGITAADTVDFSYNQLVGVIDYYWLPTCTLFNLSHNQISENWVGFGGKPAPTKLDASHNKFTFQELESVFSNLPVAWTYAPQDTLLPVHFSYDSVFVAAGGTLSNNTYNWYDGAANAAQIVGDSSYKSILSGGYHAQVTSAVVTGLTLYSDTIAVNSWTGAVSTDWNTAGNWGGNAVPSAISNVIIPTGATYSPLISNSLSGDSVNNLTIFGGAILTITNKDTLSVLANINNGDTIKANTGTVNIIGTVPQTIKGTLITNNLIINNSAGATITGDTTTVLGVYTPVTGTLTVGGSLLLASNANGTASVAQGAGNYITGNVIVERYIPAHRAWRILTAPISNSGSVFANWQNNGLVTDSTGAEIWSPSGTGPTGNGLVKGGSEASIEYYDPIANNWGDVTNTITQNLSGETVSAANNGYALFVTGPYGSGRINTASGAAATTLIANGQLQTGTQTFTYNSLAANNFILVGNPYASPVNFTQIGINGAAGGNINGTMWAWDASRSNTSYGGYVTFSLDPDGKTYDQDFQSDATAQTINIQSGEAVFVQAANNGTATVTFNETDKGDASTVTGAVFGLQPTAAQQVRIGLSRAIGTGYGQVDAVLAKFGSQYTAGVKDDAAKLYNYDENLAFTISGNNLSIVRRPVPAVTDTLYLNISALKNNTGYSFTVTPQNLTGWQKLEPYLADSYLKTETPVSTTTNTTVTFSTNSDTASYNATRFTIIFKTAGILAEGITLKAWQNEKVVEAAWTAPNERGIQQYQVQRSADGNNFVTVNTTTPRNSGNTENYAWTDENPLAGEDYYRVQSINNSGAVSYSNVILVKMSPLQPSFSIYPNLVRRNRQVTAQLNNMAAGKYVIEVYDISGKQVVSSEILLTDVAQKQTIVLPDNVSAGSYRLVLTDGNGHIWKQQLLVQ